MQAIYYTSYSFLSVNCNVVKKIGLDNIGCHIFVFVDEHQTAELTANNSVKYDKLCLLYFPYLFQ